MKISDYKSHDGTGGLKGFFKITLDCGLVIKCSIFEQENGARWIGMPQRQWVKRNGTTAYEDQIDYVDAETEERFHRAVFDELDRIRSTDKPKAEEGETSIAIGDDDIPF